MKKEIVRDGGIDMTYFLSQQEVAFRKEKGILLKRMAELDKKIMEIRKIKHLMQHKGNANVRQFQEDDK